MKRQPLDEATIRKHLDMARAHLDVLEEKRDALLGLVQSYEFLLRHTVDEDAVRTEASAPHDALES